MLTVQFLTFWKFKIQTKKFLVNIFDLIGGHEIGVIS